MKLVDQTLPANAMVMPWLISANRDERVFDGQDRFDISREHKDHIAFGCGAHFCLGTALARLEARVALGTVLDRFAELRVVPGANLARCSRGVLGSRNIPVIGTR